LNDLDEVVKAFLIESGENVDHMGRDPIALERDPGDRSTLASVFRAIHTIKGSGCFLALDKRMLAARTHGIGPQAIPAKEHP
jgi:two-component system, chemotaxis family, sensor kinase CheA